MKLNQPYDHRIRVYLQLVNINLVCCSKLADCMVRVATGQIEFFKEWRTPPEHTLSCFNAEKAPPK